MERLLTDIVLERRSTRIALEGPPIYLYPERDSQQWGSNVFVRGWQLTDRLQQFFTAREQAVAHWVLIDDFNYQPSTQARPEVTTAVSTISAASAPLREINIFQRIPQDYQAGRGFWESDFYTGKAACNVLDSGFQIQKLVGSLERKPLSTKAEELPLLLTVHPGDFRRQQETMLSELLGRMKQPPYLEQLFKQTPVNQRKRLIEQVFVHAWLSTNGDIESISTPRWNDKLGKFQHQEV